MQTLFEDEAIFIRLDADVLALEWVFRQGCFIDSPMMRKYLDVYLDIYRAQRPHFARLGGLYDTRHFAAMLPEDAEYSVKVNAPQLVAAGMRREAFILPTSAFGRMSIADYSQHVEGISSRIFDSRTAAITWLAQEPVEGNER